MCAILDASVVGEVFCPDRIEAALKFFKWINTGSGRLVGGGKLLEELDANSNFKIWRHQAHLAGRFRVANMDDVNTRTEVFRSEKSCRSGDQHVLALAQVSGARLLYSNDKKLQQDFTDRKLINQPRGRVYSTKEHRDFRDSHKKLLRRRDLCRAGE